MSDDDSTLTTQHPSTILRQIARSMNGRDTGISITIPKESTWQEALRAVVAAIGSADGPVTIFTPRSNEVRRRIRQQALDNVAYKNAKLAAPPLDNVVLGLPIQTKYDVSTMSKPKPISKEARQRLRESALQMGDYREPYYITVPAYLGEKSLPLVKGNLVLTGLFNPDLSLGDETLNMVDMLWDTGAQATIITSDVLSEAFTQFLKGDPGNDDYRTEDGVRVQVEANIALSNALIQISAIAWVVPKDRVPNQRSGIILGQNGCIDRISHRSIPRRIMQAKGEEVGEGVWGEIVVDGYLDEDENYVSI